MPLFGGDAYDDEAFSRLTFAEQGFYWWLAWWQWQEGSIPSDLEAILDKLPRKKADEAERAWPAVSKLFPSLSESLSDRRANPNLERRRLKWVGERGRRQLGARLTNEKRWGNGPEERRTETALESTRSADPLANHVQTPDFALAQALIAKIDASALKVHPPEQTALAWMAEFTPELIVETLSDCEDQYKGKHFRYLEQILVSRRDNPEQRPGRRREKRQHAGNNGDGSSKGPDGLTIPPRPDDYWT